VPFSRCSFQRSTCKTSQPCHQIDQETVAQVRIASFVARRGKKTSVQQKLKKKDQLCLIKSKQQKLKKNHKGSSKNTQAQSLNKHYIKHST